MFARIAIAAVSVMSLASFASAGQRIVFNGSHDPGRSFTVVSTTDEPRPYTLAGPDTVRQQDTSIRVGNRVVAPSVQR